MKNIIRNITRMMFVMLILLSIGINAQNKVGINTDEPQAVLEIKSDNGNEVLRVTGPSQLSNENLDQRNYVFFTGIPVMKNGGIVGYDLRKISLGQIIEKFTIEVPTNNAITIINEKGFNFTRNSHQNKNTTVYLDKLIENSNEKMFEFIEDNKSIRIKQSGYYNVNAFVGFEQLGRELEPNERNKNLFEGDIIISVARKQNGQSDFTNFKRNVISRSGNDNMYSQGTGVGASFSFVYFFEEGEELNLVVNKVYTNYDIRLLPEGSSLTVTRISKGSTKIQ